MKLMAASNRSSSLPELLLASSSLGRTSDIFAGPSSADSPTSGGVGRFLRGLSKMSTPRSASDGSPLKNVARFNLKTARSSSDFGPDLETGFVGHASSATTVVSREPRDEDAILPRQDWAQPVQWGARITRFPGDGTTAGMEGQILMPRAAGETSLGKESMGRFVHLSDAPQLGPQRHRCVPSSLRDETDSYSKLKGRMTLPHNATGRRMLKAQQLGENA